MMQGIILAGGTGSRLYPLTKTINKHLLPVGNKPMIHHLVDKLVQALVTDILIVSGKEHAGTIINYLGSGKDFNCTFTYRVQDEPDGIAGALSLAEGFVKDRCCVLLGDNMFSGSLIPIIRGLSNYAYSPPTSYSAKVVLYRPDDIADFPRFGVATLGSDCVSITEKPTMDYLKSIDATLDKSYIVTGIYIYDKSVFDVIKLLQKSDRQEYEITDVNRHYLSRSSLAHTFLEGWWTDAGTFDSYYKANNFVKH